MKKTMKKVMKETMEIVFILDRSGSMAGLEQDTIGGFNSLIEKQKQRTSRASPFAFGISQSHPYA